MTLKATSNKRKIDKQDFIKIKYFGSSKDMVKNMKRQLIEREKIFENHNVYGI
jgi:hypothetical protein